jgi:predicted RNA-binding Zn ribbon-like protein
VSIEMQPVNRYTSVVVGSSSPGPRIVEAFLNTVDERSFSRHGVRHAGGDALATPAQLAAWLAGHGLVAPGTQADADDLAAALALRTALRGSLVLRTALRGSLALRAGQPPGDRDLSRINDVLARFPLRLDMQPDGMLRLSPGSVGAGIGGIAAIVAGCAANGSWHRLRICAAPDCRWVFYDTSRNGAGRWCSMATCGNRDKTRRYRDRRQAASA